MFEVFVCDGHIMDPNTAVIKFGGLNQKDAYKLLHIALNAGLDVLIRDNSKKNEVLENG